MDTTKTYLEAPSLPRDYNSSPVAIVTSSKAQNDIDKIKSQHSDIVSGIQTQQTNISNAKAKADADAAAKAQADAQAKLDQAKIDIEKKNADTKAKAIGAGGTEPSGVDASGNAYYTSEDIASNKALTDENALNLSRQKASEEYTRQAKKVQDTIDQIRNGSVPLTPAEQAQIDGLKQQFGALIEEQKLTNIGAQGLGNIRGYQTGAAEYDPTFQAKTIGSIVTAGLNKVADLNIKMSSAVAQLTTAFQENKIALIKDSWEVYKDAQKQRQDVIDSMIKESQDKIKESQDKIKEVEKQNTEILLDLAKNNAPEEVIQAVNNAPTIAEKVTAAGDYLTSGTGVIGEYQFYKRQAQAMGQVPVDFNTYQNMDANRKIKIASAGVGSASNLSSKETTLFNSLVDKYNKSPLVAAYDRTLVLRDIINTVKSDPSNATAQLSLAYGFIQALDTYQSAVREGELSLINSVDSKTGQLKNWTDKITNGQIVRPEVALQIAGSAETLVNAIESGAKQKQKSFSGQANINSKAVGDAFNDYIEIVNDIKSSLDPVKIENDAKQKIISLTGAEAERADRIMEENPSYSYTDVLQIMGIQ